MKFMNLVTALLITSSIILTAPTFAKPTTKNPVTYVKDGAITALIEAKIALDKHIASSDIKVKTDHGKVTLIGTVNSGLEVNNLIQLVQSTTGVQGVDASKVTVKESNQPFTDLAITTKVKALFIKEKLFGSHDVPAIISMHVETNNGVVYLTGTAEAEKPVENAIKLAKSISGVVRVEAAVNIVAK